MIEFGKTLREAREAKGYTVGQLAEKTHIMHQIVEEMEIERFTRIPAPIYGRGFVKLYCEAVGLDPKPFIAAYMELQSGKRASAAPAKPQARAIQAPPKQAAAESQATPPPKPADPPPPPMPPHPQPPPPVAARQPPELQPPPPMPPHPQPPKPMPSLETQPLRPRSVYAPPRQTTASPADRFPEPPRRLPELDPRILRIGIVVIVAAGAIWALAALGRILYRATMTAPAAEPHVAVEAETPPQAQSRTNGEPAETPAAAPRTPQEIPPLYID